MQTNELERARSALFHMSPDMPRSDWVKAGMGAHAAGLTFDDFDQWSAAGSNYKAPECRATWRSFKAGRGVGAASLFGMAQDDGWTEGDKPTQRPKQATTRPVEPPRKPAPGNAPDEVWGRALPATNAHDYVSQKSAAGVPLGDLRVLPENDPLRIAGEPMAGALLVPVRRTDGTLSTLQLIPPADVVARLKAQGKPGKLNLPACPVDGFHVVGELVPGGAAYIVEGIGQAWACWQATGAAAVVSFGAGNMSKVAHALRDADPSARLCLVPDTGKESDAEKIGREIGAIVAYMPGGEANNFDANDLSQRDGRDVLEALLLAAREPDKPMPLLKPVSVFDVLTNPAPPPEFVWDGYLPRGVVALLGAHGGTGKSTIALMLVVCAALGRPLFGVDTVQCKTLFVSLEDGAHIVRHRLAGICKTWAIDPRELDGKLHIVDGTENPELFSADARGAGDTTSTYSELCKLVQATGAGLVVVDNASDAFGGDEINRRQVRAFMRSLAQVARLTNCAALLLAHVDKGTSRNRTAQGGEGYSGSTAWHNSARSRLFMSRAEDGLLTLEHQKSNLSKLREPLSLVWLDAGLPMLASDAPDVSRFTGSMQGRADDKTAAALLGLIAEFESRGQFCSPAITSRNHVHAVLKVDPAFKVLKLHSDDTKRLVNQCQRAKWLEPMDYRTPDRKPHQRWTLTPDGRMFAGLPAAPTAPTTEDGASMNMAQGGAPTAPTCRGGVGGERAHEDGAQDGANTDSLVQEVAP